MSEDALLNRISKIKNTPKMLSFIEVLEANGKDELADIATKRLAQLMKQK
eukprot:gene26567-18334_t